MGTIVPNATSRPADTAVTTRPAAERRRRAVRRGPRGLVVPAVAYLVVVTQLPFVFTIVLSLRSWNLLHPERGHPFTGLDNFKQVFGDPQLTGSVWRTLELTFLVVALALLLGAALALLVHRQFPGRGLVRTLLITPMLVMPVASALVWKNMIFHPVYGTGTWLLEKLGLGGGDILAQHPMLGVVMIGTWQWAPFAMIILLAGLSALDRSQLEAARVDGATGRQTFRHIVLPHLSSYVTITVLLGVVLVLPAFDVIYITTGGGPNFATTNLAFAVYKVAFANYDVGVASALALINALFSIIVATVLIRLLGRVIVRGEVVQ